MEICLLMPLCNIVDCNESDDLTAWLAGYGGWLVMEAGWLFSCFFMKVSMKKQENHKGFHEIYKGIHEIYKGIHVIYKGVHVIYNGIHVLYEGNI